MGNNDRDEPTKEKDEGVIEKETIDTDTEKTEDSK